MKQILFKSFIIFLSAFSIITAQQIEFVNSIGKFKSASSFYISASGIIYVTDSGNDQVTSLDTLGNVLQTTGGYGWVEAAFDEPVDVFATPLSIYVSDKNNHRIQRFDRDLNFISSLMTRERENSEYEFGYPLGCAVSNQGDIYILDSENQRVIKSDLFGNFMQNFGGFDAGNYQLNNPRSLAVSPDNKIYVLDKSGIVVFDAFGNGEGRIVIGDNLVSIRIIFDNLTVNSNNRIYRHHLRSADSTLQEFNLEEIEDIIIISSINYNEKLYVLTPREILIFSEIH